MDIHLYYDGCMRADGWSIRCVSVYVDLGIYLNRAQPQGNIRVFVLVGYFLDSLVGLFLVLFIIKLRNVLIINLVVESKKPNWGSSIPVKLQANTL